MFEASAHLQKRCSKKLFNGCEKVLSTVESRSKPPDNNAEQQSVIKLRLLIWARHEQHLSHLNFLNCSDEERISSRQFYSFESFSIRTPSLRVQEAFLHSIPLTAYNWRVTAGLRNIAFELIKTDPPNVRWPTCGGLWSRKRNLSFKRILWTVHQATELGLRPRPNSGSAVNSSNGRLFLADFKVKEKILVIEVHSGWTQSYWTTKTVSCRFFVFSNLRCVLQNKRKQKVFNQN